MKSTVERGASTRERVLASLLADGPTTATDLAHRLGLSVPGVRRHLDALVAQGSVEGRERAPYGPTRDRGRGRPAAVFALTPAGRERFPQAYDTLARDLARHLRGQGGDAAVVAFAEARSTAQQARYADRVTTAVDPVAALADALSADGFAAAAERAPGGVQLCQHHCPVAHAAADMPELCEAETAMFARLLGRHVQRLATIAHGDHVCTTVVPDTPVPASTGSARLQGRTAR